MPKGVPGSGKAKAKPAAAAATKGKRGGAKGPRRAAAIRLKEARDKYETLKSETAKRLAVMEAKISVLETAAAREEDVGTIRKRYAEKSDSDIDREFQEALKKIAEIRKIRKA